MHAELSNCGGSRQQAFDTLCEKVHYGFLGGKKDLGLGETKGLPAVSLLGVPRNQLDLAW